MDEVPAFGQADLTNCEREPIHLAGSVQPHGALVLVREPGLVVEQASANTAAVFGIAAAALVGQPLAVLGDALAAEVARLAAAPLAEPAMVRVWAGAPLRDGFAAVHRMPGAGLVVEFEPVEPPAGVDAPRLDADVLAAALANAVQRFGAAASLGALFDAVAASFRELTGYDRVMVYRFDPDGHGKVIAEARHARLESLLGHHYPASDIPAQARALYLRNRVRMLVDVDYVPQPLEPALHPATGAPLDMSMCHLRSMSPLHLQYLRNMGVTATLTASLVHGGKLWGLIAAHHYAPRCLHHPMRAAADLLSEVASTRIAAIENYAHVQVALMVRRLEQHLVEATSAEGDWRAALFRNPRLLLQPLEATGAVLFHAGETVVSGEVPTLPELRALLDWMRAQPEQPQPLAVNALAKLAPALASLAPTASGVLAVRLSARPGDYLVWLRKEQLHSVTWAGEPHHKTMAGNDPLQLSPRHSFAAWSEIVRGTAVPWTDSEVALAGAVGGALADLIGQVDTVRLLIAEHQLAQVRRSVAGAREPVLAADREGRVIFANDAFTALRGEGVAPGTPLAALFTEANAVAPALASLGPAHPRWQRELELVAPGGALPVSMRVELVASRGGPPLGFIVVLADLREHRRAALAREQLESSLRRSAGAALHESDEVVTAILTHASLAAMDIADARGGPPVAPLLEALEASTQRAAGLYRQIREFLE
jgi:chemotaxis family two-component system sensor kinase Cph1